ncbi:hypothetical protein FXO37_15502 [Capsicum annuum]|nr:hypothetical protein FXO37_15502 [Capsicum annuum]
MFGIHPTWDVYWLVGLDIGSGLRSLLDSRCSTRLGPSSGCVRLVSEPRLFLSDDLKLMKTHLSHLRMNDGSRPTHGVQTLSRVAVFDFPHGVPPVSIDPTLKGKGRIGKGRGIGRAGSPNIQTKKGLMELSQPHPIIPDDFMAYCTVVMVIRRGISVLVVVNRATYRKSVLQVFPLGNRILVVTFLTSAPRGAASSLGTGFTLSYVTPFVAVHFGFGPEVNSDYFSISTLGMPLSIQMWLYECCSNVPPKITSKVDNRIPRLLNWKTIAPRPHFEFLINAMFNDNGKIVFKNIEPTKKEPSKLQMPKKDAIEHERSVNSDDDFQDPPPRKINEHSKKKQKVDSSTPVAKRPLRKKQVNEHTQTRTPAPHAAKADGMKTPIFKPIPTRQTSSSKTKEGKQTARVIFPQVQSKPDIHIEEVALSKPESHVEKEDFISKKDFDAFRDEHIDVCLYYLRKKSKYGLHSSYKNESNKSYKYSTVDCNFMNVIRSLNDVHSMDHQNLNAAGQEYHIIEYINGFCMHAAVPWHTVKVIFIPVNIKKKHHWVLAILLFSERCIFLYDSYESSGHYAAVLAEIEKIAMIIPLCLQDCDFYVKKGIDLQNHPRYKDKESTDMFDVLFEDDLPQ